MILLYVLIWLLGSFFGYISLRMVKKINTEEWTQGDRIKGILIALAFSYVGILFSAITYAVPANSISVINHHAIVHYQKPNNP